MYEIINNKSHIPNNPLRDDILEAAMDYIGRVYAYDSCDRYLAIDRTNLKVCLTNERFPVKPYTDWVYYNAIAIIKCGDAATIEPDQLAIDAITLDFFPIERLENFRKTANSAITEFVKERGIIQDAIISFPIDTFNVEVRLPDEIETLDTYDMTLEELDAGLDEGIVEVIDIPLKDYVRMRGDKIVVNELKLFKVAIDNYYGE